MNPASGSLPNKDFQMDIVHSGADDDYRLNKNDVGRLGKGKKVTRLRLSPTNSDATTNKATYVYVETGIKAQILSKIAPHKYVSINRKDVDGKKGVIVINIESLSKRLAIEPDKIKEEAEKGTLVSLMRDHYQKHLESEELRQHTLDLSLASYFSAENKLAPEDLKRIVFIASRQLIHQSYVQSDALSLKNHEFSIYITRSETGPAMRMIAISKDILGEGAVGQVFRAEDWITGEKLVVKKSKAIDGFINSLNRLALEDLQALVQSNLNLVYTTREECIEALVKAQLEKAERDTINELAILLELNSSGFVLGIQHPPHYIYEATDYEKGTGKGYIAPFYNMGPVSRNNLNKLTRQQCLDCAWELLNGGAHCARKGVVVGDIKPDNCLMKMDEQGFYHAVLSDFGSAQKLSNENMGDWESPTPEYILENDRDIFDEISLELQKTADSDKKEELQSKLHELQLKRDVYALGKTLNETFFKALFTWIDKNPSEQATSLKMDIESLIQGMMNPNYEERLSMEEALYELDAISDYYNLLV